MAIVMVSGAGVAAHHYVTDSPSSLSANDRPLGDTKDVPMSVGMTGPSDLPTTPRPSHTPSLDLHRLQAPHTSPPEKPSPSHRSNGHPSRSKTNSRSKANSKGTPAERAVIRLTNAERARHGCPPVHLDTRLRTAARRHSADMRAHHYFSHDSLDGRTPWDRIKASGYAHPGAENIAKGYSTAEAVMNGWMDSPGHRANILNCALKSIGVGVARGKDGPWWTQDFGTS